MAMSAREIELAIRAALPDADVTITDLAAMGIITQRWWFRVPSRARPASSQHKMVYDALSAGWADNCTPFPCKLRSRIKSRRLDGRGSGPNSSSKGHLHERQYLAHP